MRKITVKINVDIPNFENMDDMEQFEIIEELINKGSEAINAESEITEIAIKNRIEE